MLAHREMNTDSSPLKRSFTDVLAREANHDTLLYINHTEGYGQKYSPIRPEGRDRSHSTYLPHKRRSISISRSTSMPAQSGSATSAVFPSFMSIFGNGSQGSNVEQGKPSPAQQKPHDTITSHSQPTSIPHVQHSLPAPKDHCRSNSVSSVASTSESTESSPTTTSSTFDSPLMAEPSPSSSPETPNSELPGLSFRSMAKPPQHPLKAHHSREKLHPDMPSEVEQPGSIGENTRNVKNLSLKPTPILLTRPTTSSGVEPLRSLSTDSSPLRETLKTGRRKPPGLSIQTPGFATLSFAHTTSDIPPTPSTRPFLTHAQSSPQFPALVASAGGLRLPTPINLHTGHVKQGSDLSSNASFGSALHGLREEDQSLRSQEVVERGYPNGPVQIYDCGVYLYLEPTAEEASKFDTVINVAKEVKNPFETTTTSGNETVVSALRKEENRSLIPEPQTAISEISFKSAFEWPSSAASTTPTTPKASSMGGKPQPRYVHIPWDHNSEIIDDLFPLCKFIDEQVDASKKVLIHCQLGVSRSASLIIAYGLYKGYQTSFHTMYETVKERSQWVGPNMTLIYQLNDFRSKVEKGSLPTTSKATAKLWPSSRSPAKETTLTPLFTTMTTSSPDRLSMPPPPIPASARTPKLAKPNLDKQLPPIPPFESSEPPVKALETSEKAPQTIAHTTLSQSDNPPEVPPKAAATTRPLPFREIARLQQIPPHRPQEAGIIRRVFSPSRMDLAMSDEPQTPSLFSPRATEFLASPFGRTQAGELMMGSAVPSATKQRPALPIRTPTRDTLAPDVDPRAPHQTQDGGEIVRNIDEVL